MYESEYLYFLICHTLILFSICCIIYIAKSIISGLNKLIKGATHDLVEAVARLEKENKEM